MLSIFVHFFRPFADKPKSIAYLPIFVAPICGNLWPLIIRESFMRKLSVFLLSLSALFAAGAHAEQPFGWIGSGHGSAYSLKPGEFEIAGRAMRVNDTLDFLDLRADLLATTARLTDNSGDFKGAGAELRVGIWQGLELFYQQNSQDLTLKVDMPAQYEVDDLDQALRTQVQTAGFKWVLRETVLRDRAQPWSSLALEASYTQSKSDEFGGFIARIDLGDNAFIRFDPTSKFAMDRLQDEGWNARFIYTYPLTISTTASVWGGYAERDATSGTRWDIDFGALQRAFFQSFSSSEKQAIVGFNLNWQSYPRLPVQLEVEYLRIFDRKEDNQASTSPLLPSFLRGRVAGANSNITARASIAWWATPQIYLQASGHLFKNQFTGILPHYNNPISGNFSEVMYGYAELKLGVRFDPLEWF